MSRGDRVSVTTDEIALVAGGGGWMGTFGVLVRTVFTDLLEDGLPVLAYIELYDETYRSGFVAQVTETSLVFAANDPVGTPVLIENVTKVVIR